MWRCRTHIIPGAEWLSHISLVRRATCASSEICDLSESIYKCLQWKLLFLSFNLCTGASKKIQRPITTSSRLLYLVWVQGMCTCLCVCMCVPVSVHVCVWMCQWRCGAIILTKKRFSFDVFSSVLPRKTLLFHDICLISWHLSCSVDFDQDANKVDYALWEGAKQRLDLEVSRERERERDRERERERERER